MAEDRIWTSLEVAKLFVPVLTLLAVAIVGYWISIQLRHYEKVLEEDREERRREY